MPIVVVSLAVRKSPIHREVDGSSFATNANCTFSSTNGLKSYYFKSGCGTGSTSTTKRSSGVSTSNTGTSSLSKSSYNHLNRSNPAAGKGGDLSGRYYAATKKGTHVHGVGKGSSLLSSGYSSSATLTAVSPVSSVSKVARVRHTAYSSYIAATTATAAMLKKSGRGSCEVTRSF